MGTHRALSTAWIALVILVAVLTATCSDQHELECRDDTVGFRFGMKGDTTGVEDFIAVTRDADVIALAREQLLLPVSERTFHIHGPVTFGNESYNLDWDWHFIPEDWVLAEESVEVCDVAPRAISMLLADLPDTLDKVYACPFASYVKSEAQLPLTGQEP
jgi:hypothetical protein